MFTCVASFMEWRNLELDIEFECEFRYRMRLRVKPQVGLSCFSLWFFLCCGCCCLFCNSRKDPLKKGVCFLAGEGGQGGVHLPPPVPCILGRRPFFSWLSTSWLFFVCEMLRIKSPIFSLSPNFLSCSALSSSTPRTPPSPYSLRPAPASIYRLHSLNRRSIFIRIFNFVCGFVSLLRRGSRWDSLLK